MRFAKKKKAVAEQQVEEVQLHHSVDTLKLVDYMAGVVKKDYSGLVIKGNPTPLETQLAWLDIISEYHVRRNNVDAEAEMDKRQERAIYENKEYRAMVLVKALTVRYHPALAELLEEEYDYPFTEETYLEDIEKVKAELASEAAYFTDDDTEHREPKESDFLQALIQIQRVLKACPMLTPKQMTEQLTVGEYIEYCNQYDEHIKSLTQTENTEEDEQ